LPSSARTGAVALGAVAGALTLAVYLIGGNRNLNYDSNFTVANFIATPSVTDSLTRQIGVNNHPALSLLDHIVYSMGGTSELALRVVPALFGAATVGLVAGWCARRFTPVAGLAAGAIVATNPMFAGLSREVRGYSIAAFFAVASTMLLVELLDSRRGWRVYAYVASLALGLAAHLAFGVVLFGHAVFVLARGEFGRGWIRRWLVAGACGSVVYIGMLRPTGGGILNGGSSFQSSFPGDLASAGLGGRALTIIPLAILVLAGALRMRREWLAVAAGFAVPFGLLWLVPGAPVYLSPRYFFFWLVPAVAVVAALAVARWRMAITLVAVAVAAAVAYQAPRWSDDPYPARAVAAYVIRVELQGGRACGPLSASLAAYTRAPRQTDNPRGCDLFISHQTDQPSGRGFRYRWTLPAQTSVTLFSNRPRASFRPLPPVAIRRSE